MKITKGQLVITVEKYPEGYLAAVNKRYICGCHGFFRSSPAKAIECALAYFKECFG